MKKLALTSLAAFLAVSGAHAANIIDGNPLYRPDAGRFYSNFAVESNSDRTEDWKIIEEFGYGVTDDLAVFMKTGVSERETFDVASWDEFTVGVNYRALDMGQWRGDIYATYGLDTVWGDHMPFLGEDVTDYTWTLGVRGGFVGDGWVLAGHAEFDYENSESFNWADDGIHSLKLGLDAQYLLDEQWNLIGAIEYTGMLDDQFEDAGHWTGKIGANYNLDATKYIGAYIMGDIDHSTGDWEWEDGFGFGVNFGIDF